MTDSKAKLLSSNQEVVVERRKVSSLQGSVARLGKEIRSLHPHIQVPRENFSFSELTIACNTHKQDVKKLKDAVTALCARHGGGVGGEDGEEREDTEKSEVVNKRF